MSTSDENKLWLEVEQDKPLYKILIGKKRKNLPDHGWIHPCYFCSSPTARVKILKYKEELYYVFQCDVCKIYFNKNKDNN